jgi:replicative DNA helicase
MVVERMYPHSLSAEHAVLGACILSDKAWPTASAMLKVDDFYRAAHRTIFEAMAMLVSRGVAIDLLTVTQELTNVGRIEEVGGPAYIAKLIDGVPRTTNVQHYAEIVRDKSKARAGIHLAAWMTEELFTGERPSSDIIDEASRRILSSVERVREGASRSSDEIRAHINAVARGTDAPAMPTGYQALDKLITGIRKKDMTIIAARPSVGKTSFALGIAEHLSESDHVVLFSTMEMSKRKLAGRQLAWATGISMRDFERGDLTEPESERIVEAYHALKDLPLFFSESARTITQLYAWIAHVKAEVGRVDALIIDYIQLMKLEQRHSNREAEVSALSSGLKELAIAENLALVALSQLKRPKEDKSDKRPNMSQLRESGALEQDADVIILPFREEMYSPKKENEGKAEAIVAKNRDGPVGSVPMLFNKSLAQFGDMEI